MPLVKLPTGLTSGFRSAGCPGWERAADSVRSGQLIKQRVFNLDQGEADIAVHVFNDPSGNHRLALREIAKVGASCPRLQPAEVEAFGALRKVGFLYLLARFPVKCTKDLATVGEFVHVAIVTHIRCGFPSPGH